MINTNDTAILIVDIQEKLVKMLSEDTISDKATKLLKAARILGVPVVISEQYPKGLGPTLESLKQEAADDTVYLEKTDFSVPHKFDQKNILVCGIEGHVCVYQTVCELIAAGHHVEVIKDLTGSRKQFDFDLAMEKMQQLGAHITSFEIVIFEFLKSSKHPDFKEVQGLIK